MKRHFWRLLVSRLAASALGSVTFLLVARGTSPKDIGALGTVTAIAAIVLVAGDLGLSTYLPRQYAREEYARVHTGLRINRVSSTVLGVVGFVLVAELARVFSLPIALALVPIALSLDKNTDTASNVCISAGDSRDPAISFFLRRLVPLAVFALLYFSMGRDPILSYGIALVSGSVAGQLVVNRATRRAVAIGFAGLTGHENPQGSARRRVIRDSLPFLVSNLSSNARQLDVAVTTFFASPIGGGIYAAASKLLQPLYLVPSVLSLLLIPSATRMERIAAVRLVRRLYLAVLLATPMAFALGLVAQLLVVPVLGEDYAGSASILVALLTGLPLVALTGPLGSVLQSQGLQREVAVVGSSFAVLTLAMIAGGAAYWGAMGAAVALGVSQWIRATVLVLILRRPGMG